MLAWARLRFSVLFSLACGTVLGLGATGSLAVTLGRSVALGLSVLSVFGLFERWPTRLPRWATRWVLQVVAVGVTVPVAAAVIFALSNPRDGRPFYHDRDSMREFSSMTSLALFLAPWTALAALVRQKEALARAQALGFQLERSELEREAVEARLALLQAQVTPHFLFNTLANIQALVDTRSPRASDVLRSLTTYLRAAVPRLGQRGTTIGDEVVLVRAYLELMQMRMPDRLAFTLKIEPAAEPVRCPPMTLLTLVENSVRHGIDPSEEGGRIDVQVERREGRCHVAVCDTGVGLQHTDAGTGTGLSSLRERLKLAFGPDARLQVSGAGGGVRAELDFPAEPVR
jgi:sensor histidine kinase YesM